MKLKIMKSSRQLSKLSSHSLFNWWGMKSFSLSFWCIPKMLAKDMDMLAWNLKGWSISQATLAWGRLKLWNFVDDIRRYMIFLGKNKELKPPIHIWDRLTSFWSLFCTPRSEHEAHWERNFGVRTYVQSVPLIQTIHTKTIACSLSSLLWIVHFEE